jgi:hypothetical protein
MYPHAFLDVVHECGYSTQERKKMSAEFWTGMVEEAGLRTSQSRVIRKYLALHFGTSVCVAEQVISEYTSRFVPFMSVAKAIGPKKNIRYHWKDLYHVVKFYSAEILADSVVSIDKIEVCLGGDHGKGKFAFMALVVVRYKKEMKRKPSYFEYQIGQINDGKDSIDSLRPLLLVLEEGIMAMKPERDGKGFFS